MSRQDSPAAVRRIGVVGGLGTAARRDIVAKLRHEARDGNAARLVLRVVQSAAGELRSPGQPGGDLVQRQLHIHDCLRAFERQGAVDAVLLPCHLSHAFHDALAAETRLPLIDLRSALRQHRRQRLPALRRIGVLTSDTARHQRLFEQAFEADGCRVLQPPAALQAGLSAAVHGPGGLARRQVPLTDAGSPALAPLLEAAAALLAAGAETLVLGMAELGLAAPALRAHGLPVLDANAVLAAHALQAPLPSAARRFTLGVVGGIGPAATVDFLDKLVQATPATCDQDHLRLVLAQRPQIPDRTAHLMGHGADPTLALYAACRELVQAGADLIVMPCNTAHAFVDRLWPRLPVPLLSMPVATLHHLRRCHPQARRVGLLATTGTLHCRVYHQAFAGSGLELLQPDADHQALVMAAIYGPQGVKAGGRSEAARQPLLQALTDLAGRGAQAVILGCTELPLVLPEPAMASAGRHLPLLDPTRLLAQACVEQAGRHGAASQAGLAGADRLGSCE